MVRALCRATTDSDALVRRAAAARLGTFGVEAEDALEPLRASTEDRDEAVRRAALEAVQTIERKSREFRERLPEILADLESDSPLVRSQAAEDLGRYAPKSVRAVPALIRTLDDPEAKVRQTSAESLGRFGAAAKDALPELAKRADDDDEHVAAQPRRPARRSSPTGFDARGAGKAVQCGAISPTIVTIAHRVSGPSSVQSPESRRMGVGRAPPFFDLGAWPSVYWLRSRRGLVLRGPAGMHASETIPPPLVPCLGAETG